jgi:hypothetical protein
MSQYETIKSGLLEELESHRREIEDGRYNWFQVKILLNRNDISSVFECQEKNRVIKRASYQAAVFLNGRG